nr:hypothetical protein [Ruminococcus bromii]
MESVKSINKSASSSGHTTEQKPVYDFLNGFLTSYARPSRKLSTKEISSLETIPESQRSANS